MIWLERMIAKLCPDGAASATLGAIGDKKFWLA